MYIRYLKDKWNNIFLGSILGVNMEIMCKYDIAEVFVTRIFSMDLFDSF